MSWARFDDGFTQHPKIVGLSDGAFRMHVAAVCYAARNLTNGHIPAAALPGLRHKAYFRCADELVKAGVWDRIDDQAFAIHDYLKYNPSRSQVESKRDSKSMAGAKGAASRWHNRPDAPVPLPVPSSSSSPSSSRVIALYEGMGWTVNPATLDVLTELEAERIEWVEDAFKIAAEARARDVRYVTRIVGHWRDHGRECECKKPAANGHGAGSPSPQRAAGVGREPRKLWPE